MGLLYWSIRGEIPRQYMMISCRLLICHWRASAPLAACIPLEARWTRQRCGRGVNRSTRLLCGQDVSFPLWRRRFHQDMALIEEIQNRYHRQTSSLEKFQTQLRQLFLGRFIKRAQQIVIRSSEWRFLRLIGEWRQHQHSTRSIRLGHKSPGAQDGNVRSNLCRHSGLFYAILSEAVLAPAQAVWSAARKEQLVPEAQPPRHTHLLEREARLLD